MKCGHQQTSNTARNASALHKCSNDSDSNPEPVALSREKQPKSRSHSRSLLYEDHYNNSDIETLINGY